MGKIIKSYIMPHAPILIHEIGRTRTSEAQDTVFALEKAAEEISGEIFDTIILSTPHAPCFSDFVAISESPAIAGDFSKFGFEDFSLSVKNDTNLAKKIISYSRDTGVRSGFLSEDKYNSYNIKDILDHGALVPLYFINKKMSNKDKQFKFVHISTPFISLKDIYVFGETIRKAVDDSDRSVIYIASADLSHRLTHDAPAGYSPEGKKYDTRMVSIVKNFDKAKLLRTSEASMEEAGECGTRSIAMLFGFMGEKKVKTYILSYEGPFGVGYLVAKVSCADTKGGVIPESEPVALAKAAINKFINEKVIIEVPSGISDQIKEKKAGCFVSVKKGGMLRGCIGTLSATKDNLASEIINNAISSVAYDSRFKPVESDEISELEISVDVLGNPRKVNSIDELDEKVYGVIVSSKNRKGVLLPDLDGVNSPFEQVMIALEKAGISPDENYIIEKFDVKRYT